jgi:hypothetical protein
LLALVHIRTPPGQTLRISALGAAGGPDPVACADIALSQSTRLLAAAPVVPKGYIRASRGHFLQRGTRDAL